MLSEEEEEAPLLDLLSLLKPKASEGVFPPGFTRLKSFASVLGEYEKCFWKSNSELDTLGLVYQLIFGQMGQEELQLQDPQTFRAPKDPMFTIQFNLMLSIIPSRLFKVQIPYFTVMCGHFEALPCESYPALKSSFNTFIILFLLCTHDA